MRWRDIAQKILGSVVVNVLVVWAATLSTIALASYFAAQKLYNFDFLGNERADSVDPITDFLDPDLNANDPAAMNSLRNDWDFHYVDQATSPLDVFQTALAVTTALGAAAFLVISLHRNARERREESRRIAQAFADNYGQAAAQIASIDVAEQLAGLYAMANLARAKLPTTARHTPADRRGTQQCIDMICSYLRLVHIPHPDSPRRGADPVGGYGRPQKRSAVGTSAVCIVTRQARSAQQTALDLLFSLLTEIAASRSGDTEIEQYTFNLEGADLSGLTFHGESWWEYGKIVTINLKGAILRKTNLKHSYLYKTNLRHADLTEANLVDVKTKQVNMAGACLRGANLQGANLNGANLRHCDFEFTNLLRAMMHRTDLIGANLQHAQLQNAALRHSELQYASLQGANLQDANLRDVTLWGADLSSANLRRASLNHSRLQWVHPKGSNLTLGELLGVRTLASGAVDWPSLDQRLHVAEDAGMPPELCDAITDACHSPTPPSAHTLLTEFSAAQVHWAKALPDTFRGTHLEGVDFSTVSWVDDQGTELPQSRWPPYAHRSRHTHPAEDDGPTPATHVSHTLDLRDGTMPRPNPQRTERPERTHRSDHTQRPREGNHTSTRDRPDDAP